jgi:hypothetical protein
LYSQIANCKDAQSRAIKYLLLGDGNLVALRYSNVNTSNFWTHPAGVRCTASLWTNIPQYEGDRRDLIPLSGRHTGDAVLGFSSWASDTASPLT